MGKICNTFRNNGDLGFKTFHTLFNSCVLPILAYSSGVWGYKDFQCSEAIQNRAMRFYLGVNRFTPNHAISGDMGWYPIAYQFKMNMLRHWNRLVKLHDDRLTKKVFLWDLSICRNTWCANIKKVFTEIGKQECFMNITTCNLNDASNRLIELFQNIWSETIANKPKLRTYILFKQEFCTEKYVLFNLSRSERSFIAQLRAGVLPLKIETGRYVGIPVEERLCLCCPSQSVEDELHFVFECNLYNSIRNNLMSFVSLNSPEILNGSRLDMLKILYRSYPRQFAKFVKSAYERRCAYLFPP